MLLSLEPQFAYIFQGSESIVEPQQLSKTNFLAANMYFESAKNWVYTLNFEAI